MASLSDGERASFSKCSSIEEFLLDVGKLEVISTPKRRGAKFLTQIKRLSDRLQPCFKGLDLLAQSDQWSATAWGVFRLVLQLASNYVVFFEKLAKVIERVAAALPQYEQFMEIFGSGASERLKASLCQVYVDLFEFFEGVARVFTKKNGSKYFFLWSFIYLLTQSKRLKEHRWSSGNSFGSPLTPVSKTRSTNLSSTRNL